MTLAEARTYVWTRLGVSSGESSTVDSLLDRQLEIELARLVQRYRLSVTKGSLSYTSGNPVVSLPAGLTEILKLNLGEVTLEPVDWTTFAELSQAQDTPFASTGQIAYLQSGTASIRLYPTPTVSASDLDIWYVSAAAAWSAAEPTVLPTIYHDLPCERVVALLALIEEATDLAAIATARADQLEAEFRTFIGRRSGRSSNTVYVRGH